MKTADQWMEELDTFSSPHEDDRDEVRLFVLRIQADAVASARHKAVGVLREMEATLS